MQSQGYLRRIFADIYQQRGADSKRLDLRARDVVIGQYLKEQELQLKIISNYDLDQEEKLRRMSKYDFNFHIVALKRRQEAMQNNQE